MKKTLILSLVTLFTTNLLLAEWVYDSDFANLSQPHGATVDANGRVWVGYYAYTDTLGLPADTIPIKPIYVYEPDGSQASFSPIQMLEFSDGRIDTMWNGCRGIGLDHNGNVLYSAYNDVWQINYQTGEPIGALYDFPGSVTEAATTEDGYMFVTMVVPSGNPIWVFDISLNLPDDYTGAAADWGDGLVNTLFDGDNTAISRTLLVSADGKDLYHGRIYGGTHNNGVFHYYSADGPEGTYEVADILYNEVMWGQILDWGPDSTIWVGTYWDVSAGDFTGWYELDPGANYQVVGSIGTGGTVGGPLPTTAVGDTVWAPRGVTFSADGLTAYACDFDGGRVLKFTEDGNPAPAAPVQTPPTITAWEYDSDFTNLSQPHGAIVDANGRVWVGYYAYTDTLGLPDDTIAIKPIYVYEADGSQASFSPIQFLDFADGRIDTMWNGCRGIGLDHNGNILYSAYNDVWQINYQTGEAIGALYDFPGSVTEAATTEEGYMFVTMVVPAGNPIWVFDISLDLPDDYTGAAVDWGDGLVNTLFDGDNTAISRTLVVTADGKDLYHGRIYGGTHNNGVFHYHSADGPEGTYEVVDILYNEVMWGQILSWGPDSTIWVGTYWDVAAGDFTGYYEIDPGANHQVVGSIGTGGTVGGPIPTTAVGDTIWAPRGVTFSADGQTAYACDFDAGRVLKFTAVGASIDNEVVMLPKQFRLHQNYPNPFNPTTNITFELYYGGHVSLTVYDMLGREVAVLVNGEMPIGQHDVSFNARDFASGVYIYALRSGHMMESKRMTVVK